MMHRNVTAVVMAGGLSSRMGSDKRVLRVGRQTLLEHVLSQLRPRFGEVLVSANDLEEEFPGELRVVKDDVAGRGPVMGIVSAMKRSSNEVHFVQACDIPQTDLDLVDSMIEAVNDWDAVVPRVPSGHIEPLFAVYKQSALPAMMHVLENENGRASRIDAHCRSLLIDVTSDDHLRNLNTPEDYRAFLSRLK